ncbi:MAG: flagellar FlbD family protein [Acidimicrobiales bacterium]
MIPLTRLNGDPIAINPDRIERADVTPDVVLTMSDGSKFVIGETLDELIDRIRLFRASVLALSHRLVFDDEDDGQRKFRLVRGGSGTVVDRPEHVSEAAGVPRLIGVVTPLPSTSQGADATPAGRSGSDEPPPVAGPTA